jgi:hypothetical protein
MHQTGVSGGFQHCGQQYVDGHCHATTQHLSTAVPVICFELQALACKEASHCNEHSHCSASFLIRRRYTQ